MQPSLSEVSSLTIIISTTLLLVFSGIIIYFLFLYQRKRYRHQQELIELREEFNHTLLQSKLKIQEQTLDHIAKELHANFSHLVSLININLSELLPQSTNEMKESITETKSLAKQLLAELKALSASLNTDHIMHIGFTKALENELNRLIKTRRYHISLTKKGSEFRIRPEHEIILFRLCQEVLNNIVNYSSASNILVVLIYEPETFHLKFTDDGVGFDQTIILKNTEKESTGILNMQKRAKLISASLKINSAVGKGTIVDIVIPKTSYPAMI